MSRVASIWVNTTASLLAAAWQADAAAAAPAPPAGADVHTVVIHFADLNLEQPAAIATLHRRISVAAEHVCGEPRLTGSRFISDDWRRCVTQAVDQAVSALDRPTLSAYHRTHILPSHPGATIARALAAKPL
jgi:UrcA family protein